MTYAIDDNDDDSANHLSRLRRGLQFWRAQRDLAEDLAYPQLRERAENWVSRYELEIATLQQQQIEPPTR